MTTKEEPIPKPFEIEIGQWFYLEKLDDFISSNKSNIAPLFIHIWNKYKKLK